MNVEAPAVPLHERHRLGAPRGANDVNPDANGDYMSMNNALKIAFVATVRLVADIPLFWMLYLLYRPTEGEGGIGALAFNAMIFTGFAGLHSLLTRRFAKDRLAAIVGEPYVRSVFSVVSGFTLMILLVLWRPVSGGLWRLDGLANWIVSALFVLCIAGLVYTTTTIDYLDFLGLRDIVRSIKGRRARPSVFSTKGLYGYCRHPMYLCLLLANWVAPVMNHGRLEFAVLSTLFLLGGTIHEEKNLRAELGDAYDEYRRNVPMWLPRLTPWRPEERR